MAEELQQVLERTGLRASLAPEYLDGHAPGTQHKEEHLVPAEPTYYDLPALKKPAWKWYVWAYFFAGGIASGAYITAVLSDIRSREEDVPLVRAGHFVALLAAMISPVLLIADLGRPQRWYNMFRVFRTRSMLNMGTWILSFMGFFGGAGAASQLLQMVGPTNRVYRAAIQPLRVFSWLGVIPAGFLGSYTGVLLSATNVPLWARNRMFMALLFFNSALSTGLAATHLATRLFGTVPAATEARVKRAESSLLVGELAVTAASGLALRGLAKPLLSGPTARRYQLGALGLGMVAPLVLSRLPKLPGSSVISSVLTLVGGAVMRYAITEAGLRQADDPRAYFRYTRTES